MRKQFLSLIAGLALAACASFTIADISPVMSGVEPPGFVIDITPVAEMQPVAAMEAKAYSDLIN